MSTNKAPVHKQGRENALAADTLGQFFKGRILKDSARVGCGLREDGERKVAVFSGDVRVHGLLSFERLSVRGS